MYMYDAYDKTEYWVEDSELVDAHEQLVNDSNPLAQ